MSSPAPGQFDVAPTPAEPEPWQRRLLPPPGWSPTEEDARTWVLAGSGLLAVVLLCVLALLPLPYVLLSPGPVRDVLGTTDGTTAGTPMISIDGAPTYGTDGSLDMLTVAISGGPGSSSSLWSVVWGWAAPSVAVRPVDEQYPPDLTEEEIDEENSLSMVSSQESATAAALSELDVDFATSLTVSGFVDGARAAAALEQGDVLTALAGAPVADLPSLRTRLQDFRPGQDVPLTVRRDGRDVEAVVPAGRGEDGGTVLGVLLSPSYEFPYDVDVEIENIGGPSAGMMFSLGIVDLLTPGALVGGERVAGTGTIDASGDVGPIGGIRQKLYGAERADADWFLAPEANCDEVVGHVPDGLRVVRVATLRDARDAVEAIGTGAGTDALPTCGG